MLIEQELIDLVLPLLAWLLIEQRDEVLLKPLDSPLLLQPDSLKPATSLLCLEHSRKRLNHEYLVHVLQVVLELLPLNGLSQCSLNDDCLLASNPLVDIAPECEYFILPLDSIHLRVQILLDFSTYLQTPGVLDEAAELLPIEVDASGPVHCLALLLQMFFYCLLNLCC